MADVTVVGQGTFVRGSIRGEGDLEILGRVDGEVEVSGELSIGDGGLIKADVSARRVIVRGSVLGNISAQESIRLEAGARVVGDLTAATVGIADHALYRGRVETGEAPKTSAARTASSTRGKPNARADSRGEIPRDGRNDAKPAPARSAPEARPAPAKPAPAPAPARITSSGRTLSAVSPSPTPKPETPRRPAQAEERPAERQGPPPPVVPALKRGARGSFKKKAR